MEFVKKIDLFTDKERVKVEVKLEPVDANDNN